MTTSLSDGVEFGGRSAGTTGIGSEGGAIPEDGGVGDDTMPFPTSAEGGILWPDFDAQEPRATSLM